MKPTLTLKMNTIGTTGRKAILPHLRSVKSNFLSVIALLAAVLFPCFASTGSGRSHWDVVEAGAKPDGTTDCTAVFQKLLEAAGTAGGGIVEVPAGRFRISTGLSIPAAVTLQGKFSQSKDGSANGNFLGLGADSCQRAVVVEQAQPPGLLISNGEFVGRWSSTDAVCLEIGPAVEGKVSLVNCSFWGPIDRCVWMRSASSQFTASACNFVNWDNRGVGSPAIQLDAGKAIVQGCTFAEENKRVRCQHGCGDSARCGEPLTTKD